MTYVATSRQAESPSAGPAHAGHGPTGRRHVEGLPTPQSLVEMLPGALQEDEFCVRFVAALDEALGPLFATLDCIDSYFDPLLAPADFVDWLASWVGIEVDETWDPARRRSLVRNAVVLYRMRGTAPGLAAHLRLYAGVTPEIEETGGCVWSQTADTALPGVATPSLTVRLRVDDDEGLRLNTISRIVAASRPAQVPYVVELIAGGETVQVAEDEADTPVSGASGDGAGGDGPPSGADDAGDVGAVDLPGSEHIELAVQAPTIDDGEAEAALEDLPPAGGGEDV